MKIVLTGATGRIGFATLACLLQNPQVSSVIAVSRRDLDVQHDKLKVLIHHDLSTWPLFEDELAGADGCIWALGVIPSKLKSYEDAYNIEVKGALSAARYFASVKARFIYVSAFISVSGVGEKQWYQPAPGKIKGIIEHGLKQLDLEAYVAKTAFVVDDASTLAMLSYSLFIKRSEMAAALANVIVNGHTETMLTNAQLVMLGRESLKKIASQS